MRVHVENDIYIGGNGLGFTIQKMYIRAVKDKETKEITCEEEVYETIGYYNTLTGCINGIVKMKIVDSQAATLQELLQEAKQIREDVTALIQI